MCEAIRKQLDVARSLFDEKVGDMIGVPAGSSTTEGGETRSLKQDLFRLEKLCRKEINRSWKVIYLDNYIEVGRVPRGLRIRITLTYQNPSPKLLEEWPTLMAATCKQMLGLPSKYVAIELQQVAEEICTLREALSKHGSKEEIANFLKNMDGRLTKYEDSIKSKKLIRDRNDYAQGWILTFDRKYDLARKDFIRSESLRNQTPQTPVRMYNQTWKIDKRCLVPREDHLPHYRSIVFYSRA